MGIMGDFIGGAGAAFIMAAAIALVVKLMLDVGLIKNRESVIESGKISLCCIIVGVVYISAAALMYNELHGQTNFFAFDKTLAFFDTTKVIGQFERPQPGELLKGLGMPLYPYLVHISGKLVFGQYLLSAEFISFVCACVSACLLYAIPGRDAENADRFMLLAASLPYAFMLFTPSYISLTVMFILMAAYALSRGNKKLWLAASVLALLSGKAGIIAFMLFPLNIPRLIGTAQRAVTKNGIIFRIIISLLILFNGAVMYWLIKGLQ